MEEKKNIPTVEGEAITPEAPAADIPGTDAPSPDLTAGAPPQEQAGVTVSEPGDVVVSFDKIEELMAERRAAARDTVEQAEPAAPEVAAPVVEQAEPPTPEAPAPGQPEKAAEQAQEEKPQEEVAAEQKKPRRGRPPKAEKTEQAAPKADKEQTAAKPRRDRPPKADKAAPDKAKPQPRDKMSQSKPPAGKGAPVKAEASAATEQPPAPRDAPRGVKEEIVYLNLSELHPFKNHPFSVRDDAEMQGPVESVKVAGVNQPALVRPREGGGYEIIAGHRRQRASELAGFVNGCGHLLGNGAPLHRRHRHHQAHGCRAHSVHRGLSGGQGGRRYQSAGDDPLQLHRSL